MIIRHSNWLSAIYIIAVDISYIVQIDMKFVTVLVDHCEGGGGVVSEQGAYTRDRHKTKSPYHCINVS